MARASPGASRKQPHTAPLRVEPRGGHRAALPGQSRVLRRSGGCGEVRVRGVQAPVHLPPASRVRQVPPTAVEASAGAHPRVARMARRVTVPGVAGPTLPSHADDHVAAHWRPGRGPSCARARVAALLQGPQPQVGVVPVRRHVGSHDGTRRTRAPPCSYHRAVALARLSRSHRDVEPRGDGRGRGVSLGEPRHQNRDGRARRGRIHRQVRV